MISLRAQEHICALQEAPAPARIRRVRRSGARGPIATTLPLPTPQAGRPPPHRPAFLFRGVGDGSPARQPTFSLPRALRWRPPAAETAYFDHDREDQPTG